MCLMFSNVKKKTNNAMALRENHTNVSKYCFDLIHFI